MKRNEVGKKNKKANKLNVSYEYKSHFLKRAINPRTDVMMQVRLLSPPSERSLSLLALLPLQSRHPLFVKVTHQQAPREFFEKTLKTIAGSI